MTALLLAAVSVFNPALSVGPDAIAQNPAQLALPERLGFSCRILNLAAGLDNNSFSFGQYNRYTGAFLDERAKADILGSVPRNGMNLGAGASAGAAEFGHGTVAASVRTVADGELSLPRDLFDLVLYGNGLGRTYSAEPTLGRAQVLFRAGVGAATGVGRDWTVGAGVHYLRGLFYAEIIEASGQFTTTPVAFTARGRGAYRLASGGNGWTLDLGATYRRQGWVVGLGVLDAGTGILWTDGVQAGEYSFRLDSADAYQVLTEERFSQTFSQQAGIAFTTWLPVRMNLSLGRRVFEWLNCGLTLEPVWRVERFSLKEMRSSFVAEAWPLSWLPVGASVSYRSGRGLVLGLDAGVIRGRFCATVGASDVAGLFGAARGAHLRLGVGYGTFVAERDRVQPRVLRLAYGVN